MKGVGGGVVFKSIKLNDDTGIKVTVLSTDREAEPQFDDTVYDVFVLL